MRTIITKAIALLIAFSTATLAQEKGSFTDPRDKKKYKTVKIGEQVWMAENLNYNADSSKCYGESGVYNSKGNVDKLPKVQTQANCTKYGKLYNWETAIKACPAGWHLPFKTELEKLLRFADSTSKEVGSKLLTSKEAGNRLKSKSGWNKNGNGTDNFGFSALPGGLQTANVSNNVGEYGGWWGATDVSIVGGGTPGYLIYINNYEAGLGRDAKSNLYSIRCIQGDEAEAAKAEAEENAAKEKAEAEAKAAKEKADAEALEAIRKVNGGTFTDTRDKKTYKTIKINGQVWLAENLNYAAENSKCYDNKPENCTKYGKLYNWETAMKSCPAGWHLPKNAEWDKLYHSADGTSGTESPYKSKTAGKYLKFTSGWDRNGNGTDKFGFSALPGGFAYEDLQSNIRFRFIGTDGNWWSSTSNNDNVYWTTINNRDDYTNFQEDKKGSYMSVRCIKD